MPQPLHDDNGQVIGYFLTVADLDWYEREFTRIAAEEVARGAGETRAAERLADIKRLRGEGHTGS